MVASKRGIGASISLVVLLLAGGADESNSVANDKKALAAAQSYVGAWRGVGQPKRGSNQGAWSEESEWSWRFDGGRARLLGAITGDKYFSQWQLEAGDDKSPLVLLATPIENGQPVAEPVRYTGGRANEGLVFTAEEVKADQPARISLRLVAGGDRMVALYEKRTGGTFARLAEVGLTRKGSSFAKNAGAGRECVVTGGLGTIAVEHEGKKYYVCCSGCRDLFNEDPAGVLKEYRERKAAEAAEKEK